MMTVRTRCRSGALYTLPLCKQKFLSNSCGDIVPLFISYHFFKLIIN